jgi:uncharacterized protein (UPF0333 family)
MNLVKNPFARAGVIVILTVIATGILFASSQPEKTLADCKTVESNSRPVVELYASQSGFTISDNSVIQCTKLIVTNSSQSFVAVAFGLHDEHYPYTGYQEKTIRQGESIKIILAEAGTFRVHNHYIEDQFVELTIEKDSSLQQSMVIEPEVEGEDHGH